MTRRWFQLLNAWVGSDLITAVKHTVQGRSPKCVSRKSSSPIYYIQGISERRLHAPRVTVAHRYVQGA